MRHVLAVPASEVVPDRVAEDRSQDARREDGRQGDMRARSKDASEDDRELPGNDEAEEEGCLRRGEEGSGGQRLGARLGHPPLADAPQQHSVQRDGPELGKPARVDGFEHAPKAIAGEGP